MLLVIMVLTKIGCAENVCFFASTQPCVVFLKFLQLSVKECGTAVMMMSAIIIPMTSGHYNCEDNLGTNNPKMANTSAFPGAKRMPVGIIFQGLKLRPYL